MRAWPTSTRRVLQAHDRFGHRIDQVEFHPSYHALMAGALRHGLHGTPWTEGAGGHVERAAAFMLFTETRALDAVPGVDDLRRDAGAARQRRRCSGRLGPKLASTQYDARFLPFGAEDRP